MLRVAMPRRFVLGILLAAFFYLTTPVSAAYQPVLEQRPAIAITNPEDLYEFAMRTGDPTFASYAIFGELKTSGEVDMYVFIVAKDDVIPIELTIPAKTKYVNLRPTVVLVGPFIRQDPSVTIPFALPLGVDILPIPSPEGSRERTFDLMSVSWYYRGNSRDVPVSAGEIYFLAVFDPAGSTGEYVVTMGNTQNFSGSVMDTLPVVDPLLLVFEHSRPEERQRALEDKSFRAQTAKQWFFTQKTPFETLDSRIKLFFDLAGFYILRIPAWLK